MTFDLNLNLELDWESKQRAEFFPRLQDSLRISSESISIISLIEYCQLKPGVHLKFNFYYSTSKFLEKIRTTHAELPQNLHDCIIDTLDNEYPRLDLKHSAQLKDDSKNELNTSVIDLDNISIENYIFDTDLPSLKRKMNENCDITITGLASLYRDLIKIKHRLNPELNYENLLGYRQNCLKACSQSSMWTYLCETQSVNLYKSLLANSTDQIGDIKEYFQQIQDVLRKPLALATRNSKDIKQRSEKLKLEANSNLSKFGERRFLEDHFMTISDMIVFFFLTLILGKKEGLVEEIQNNYPEICLWYEQMKRDLSFLKAFSQNLFVNTFNLDDLRIQPALKDQNKIAKLFVHNP